MPRRTPWILAGVGLTLAVQFLGLLGLAARAATRLDDDVTTMTAPQAVRVAESPPWPVGTCLAGRDVVPCAAGHQAEVVAVVDPGREDDEERRRWIANSSCAREVSAVVADLDAALVTYASVYPDDRLQVGDSRVRCLLVAASEAWMTGSWTAGDLDGPHPPDPFE
ncbi:hypothetical protein [Kineococcus sp. SYSU DK003]|uniref:hypothetical protein n=1 Tax=Kineococcus sp. SYSU DK003 TaxID=3383124 RepID=UPI003D7E96C2